jgi:prepilin-type N-terminal cleavage/methylation domain-containing protein
LRRAGFTLVEICVASAILALIAASVLGVLVVGRRSASLAENHLAALHIARSTLETLGNKPFNSTELQIGTTQLPGNRGNYVVESVDARTKNVTVNIDWVEPSGTVRTLSLTTSFSWSLHQ